MYEFGRKIDEKKKFILYYIDLDQDGSIKYSGHPNETYWEFDEGNIVFKSPDKNPSTIFDTIETETDICGTALIENNETNETDSLWFYDKIVINLNTNQKGTYKKESVLKENDKITIIWDDNKIETFFI